MSKSRKVNSLQDIGNLVNKDELAQVNQVEEVEEVQDKDEYQAGWRKNKYNFREMVAKKNRAWLLKQSEESEFEYYKEFPNIYNKIFNMFHDEKKRKWLIHIITNFLPVSRAVKVPKIPTNKHICPFTGYELTDTHSLLTGDRDKHLGFTGDKTDVIMSGVALQELERFAIYCTKEFDTREGHIVNFALDQIRTKDTEYDKSKNK